jgi:AcrB/AcrD/AcrF family
MLMGMGLVILILFIFLGDLASAGIVAIMIPLALLFSISVLYLQGKSANLLSIGAVDFGIIVDSSTIIVENIYRHITAHDADRSRPLVDRLIGAWATRSMQRPSSREPTTARATCTISPTMTEHEIARANPSHGRLTKLSGSHFPCRFAKKSFD